MPQPLLTRLSQFFQYDLFDALPGAVVDLLPKSELPPVLAKHKHGVQLGEQFVTYQLKRSKRRSIGFQIADDGLQITAPRWVSVAEINDAIVSKQRWIIKHLKEQSDRPARPAPVETVWTSGATLPFMGKIITLQVEYGAPTHLNEIDNKLTLNLPSDASPDLCKRHLQSWLMGQARKVFSDRLKLYAEQLGVTYHSFKLSSANTRWGTCSETGKILLNWRLIHFRLPLIDYVIAHELSHLHEMNHSARFWAHVESVCPDYLNEREELNQLARQTMPHF